MTVIKRAGLFLFTALCLFFLQVDVFAQGVYFDFGVNPRGRYLNVVGDGPGEDGQFIGLKLDREFCGKSTGKALYFAIDNEKLFQRPSSTSDIISIEYLDDSEREIKLVYDAVDEPNKVAEPVIKTTGSNLWKSATFYLEDSYFSDRQQYGADFHFECADTMTVNVIRVAPIDYYNDFGATNDEFLIYQKMINAGDSMTGLVEVEGEECLATTEESQYIYCDVDDAEIFEGDFYEYFISVEYYDLASQLTMRLQYDSENDPYKDMAWMSTKGWGSFNTYSWEVTDGYMGNRQNDGADFRLNFQAPGLPVNRIMLGFFDYGPSAVTSAPKPVTHFSLENYPNPFNPRTTISFELPQNEQVKLTVFDLQGQAVATLVDRELQAGVHNVGFDGAQRASGIYLYQLNAGEHVLQKKMTLIK